MRGTAGRPFADAVIVGAGVSGLACAASLRGRGFAPVVLERSRGVGGRCATRRLYGQPIDHGTAFIHGSHGAFLEAVRRVPGATVLEGWPRTIEGEGLPCVPRAFEASERRLAYAEGMTAFPKQLAQGLDVRRATPVIALSAAAGGIQVHTEAGTPLWTSSVVLAVPPPTALNLVAPLAGDPRDAAAVVALLRMIGSQSCLTVLAGYPPGTPPPPWDIRYPDESACVQLISHDSAKREEPGFVALVIQARPAWSAARLDTPEATWAAELTQEAARLVGAWAGSPSWVHAHRWRFARSSRGSELSRPLVLRVRGGGRVIITGEPFVEGGGIEGAWRAGTMGAHRLSEEE